MTSSWPSSHSLLTSVKKQNVQATLNVLIYGYSELFEPILSLFLGKEYDSEFIAQLLHAIYSFIFHGVGLERILSEG